MTIAEKNIEIIIAVKIKKRPAKTVASEGAKGLPGKVACQRFGEATFELNPERWVDPRKTAALTASFRGIAICVDETISCVAESVSGALPVESAILGGFTGGFTHFKTALILALITGAAIRHVLALTRNTLILDTDFTLVAACVIGAPGLTPARHTALTQCTFTIVAAHLLAASFGIASFILSTVAARDALICFAAL